MRNPGGAPMKLQHISSERRRGRRGCRSLRPVRRVAELLSLVATHALHVSNPTRQRSMRTMPWFCRLILCLFAVLSGAHAATFTVQTVGTNFSPSSLTIPVGSSVFFTNTTCCHNVIGYNPASEPFCGSTLVGPGPVCTVTFTNPGTYLYRCVPHSPGSGINFHGMTGSVTVVAVFVPPTVALTNPASGSVFGAPAQIAFGAAAMASNATVTNVSFLFDSNIIGRTTNEPFQFVLNNVLPGLRFLQAAATDSRGTSATSPPVPVRIIARPALAT